MNYKGLSYKTVWVEYPDIGKAWSDPPRLFTGGTDTDPAARTAALAKKIGAKPTATVDGEPLYTVPIIHDPNTGSVVADSFYIAQYLDKQYPGQPTLIPQDTDAFQVM